MGFSRQENWSGLPLPSLQNIIEFPLNSCFFLPVAFRLYDLDKDDKISRDELLQVCGRTPMHTASLCLGPADLVIWTGIVLSFSKLLFNTCYMQRPVLHI